MTPHRRAQRIVAAWHRTMADPFEGQRGTASAMVA